MINKFKVKDTIRDVLPNKIKYVSYVRPAVPLFGLENEEFIKTDVNIINPTGFSSIPDKNDDAYIFETELGEKFCIAVDTFYKPTTKPNEVCIGNFKTKNFTRFDDNNIYINEIGTENIVTNTKNKTSINSNKEIELVSGERILIKAPEVVIEGNLTVTGNLVVNGTITTPEGMIVNDKKIDDKHTHTGVTSGNGTTGGVA